MAQDYKPDYNNVNEGGEFKQIPKGKYLATCIAAEEVISKDERSIFYKCQWEIAEGEHAKRRVFGTITEKSHSQESLDISKTQLNSICKANALGANGEGVAFPRMLVGCTNHIYVKTKTYKDKDGNMVADNEVSRYFPDLPDLTKTESEEDSPF